MSINYDERIPNNVDLSNDRRLQRALEAWQPNYLDWWMDMGPEGFQSDKVYLRTAVGDAPHRSRCLPIVSGGRSLLLLVVLVVVVLLLLLFYRLHAAHCPSSHRHLSSHPVRGRILLSLPSSRG